MGGAPTSLSVCVRDHVACVRISGRANFTSSVDFKKLLLQLQEDGCAEIVLDLTECVIMDSTFLGVLASAATKCNAARQSGRKCTIKLFRPTERVLELLDNLGVLGPLHHSARRAAVGRLSVRGWRQHHAYRTEPHLFGGPQDAHEYQSGQ